MVKADGAAKLSNEQLSPNFRGGKLKMSKHASLRALRGVEGSPRPSKQLNQHNHNIY